MTELLILGAGPYGLSLAAQAKASKLDYRQVGKPMSFWKDAMPQGMLLRSSVDWHLDPLEDFTLRRYAESRGAEFEPISLSLFVKYAQAFQEHYDLPVQEVEVTQLRRTGSGFESRLDTGETIHSKAVAICAGCGPFANQEHFLAGQPRVGHTVSEVDLESMKGEKVLIVGGRQSAFEWAVLLARAGASQVHVVHRHATPDFTESDWSWVDAMMEQCEDTPGWYSKLPEEEKTRIARRFWEEGRLKLEPWLKQGLERPNIKVWSDREVVKRENDQYHLSHGETIQADRVILATGYKIDLGRLEYLCKETILPHIQTASGSPVLDAGFQSTVPGLYFTSFASTGSFGPFFGFVRGCPATARILMTALYEPCA